MLVWGSVEVFKTSDQPSAERHEGFAVADGLSCFWTGMWGFPKIRGALLEVPIIRTIVFWGLYWGSLILGNYHVAVGGYRKVCMTLSNLNLETCGYRSLLRSCRSFSIKIMQFSGDSLGIQYFPRF